MTSTSSNVTSSLVDETKEAANSTLSKVDISAKIVIPMITDELLQSLPKDIQELYGSKIKYNLNKNKSDNVSSVTFYPSPYLENETSENVSRKPDDCLLTESTALSNILSSLKISQLEAIRDWDARISNNYSSICSFIVCALKAWSEHIPLRLKPQHLWLLILQAVAEHVDQNAEALREKYVLHEKGKKKLEIVRNSFVRGSRNNDWKGVIEDFVQQIDKYTVKDTVELFESDFSTSTIVDRIATKVTIMDICKNYFEYGMRTMCGFPSITLEGKKEDWLNLRKKCQILLAGKVMKEFGEKWALALLPLIDRFIVAYDGEIDGVFWNSMIKEGAWYGSGASSWYSGWINVLFPVIKGKWNSYCVPYSADIDYVFNGIKGAGQGIDINYYPRGISCAPVEWIYHGNKINLKFVAGFIGYVEDAETAELCANVDWFIGEQKREQKREQKSGDTKTKSGMFSWLKMFK